MKKVLEELQHDSDEDDEEDNEKQINYDTKTQEFLERKEKNEEKADAQVTKIDKNSLFSEDFNLFFNENSHNEDRNEKSYNEDRNEKSHNEDRNEKSHNEDRNENKSRTVTHHPPQIFKISNNELELERDRPKHHSTKPQQVKPDPNMIGFNPMPDMQRMPPQMNQFRGPEMMMFPPPMRREEDFPIDPNDPSSFLENPVFIIKKNLIQRGWFLMTENNKILGNFNSIDLLGYLDAEFKSKNNFNNVWITDYETDIYFTASNLYEILKETVPKIIEKKKSMPSIGMNRMMPPMNNMNNPAFSMVNPMFPMNPMGPMNPMMNKNFEMGMFQDNRNPMMFMNPPFDEKMKRMSMSSMNVIPQKNMMKQPPVNMNINLQFVQNDINLNNIMLNHPDGKRNTSKEMNSNLLNKVFQDNKRNLKK
jgi:hypothetical protein